VADSCSPDAIRLSSIQENCNGTPDQLLLQQGCPLCAVAFAGLCAHVERQQRGMQFVNIVVL
jgi:hypothetical protein